MCKLFVSKLVGKEVKTGKLFPVSQRCYVPELINTVDQKAAFRQVFSVSSEPGLAECGMLSASRSRLCCNFLSKLSNGNPNASGSLLKSIPKMVGLMP